MHCFDFESHAIQPRPHYPPLPVGLALQAGLKDRPQYYGWDHPTGNNAPDDEVAKRILREMLKAPHVGHNISFDLAIAHERWGLPLPEGQHVNDTMFLAFLLDPYGELGLKPLAERYLNVPPTERDAVRDWLYSSGTVKKNVKRWGAHIAQAPGDLVGPYAEGDVSRTLGLFGKLWTMVNDRGMTEAYRRECDLVPMLLENSARGVPLDQLRLSRDLAEFEQIALWADDLLQQAWREYIRTAPPPDWTAAQIAEQLEAGGFRLPLTPTGKRSTSQAALEEALPDGPVKQLLAYRSAIQKTLTTYLRPWYHHGSALHCNWNQIRDYSDAGARTGRLSSSPNLQNITNPTKYAELQASMKAAGAWRGWMRMPDLRSYIVAPPGHKLFGVDYSQQELRVLAHFEDGPLRDAFIRDPKLDMHQFVADLVKEKTGVPISRRNAKTINFAKIYGAGRAKLAEQMGVDLDTGNLLVNAYEAALPSIRELQWELQNTGRAGRYITTLGGRRYYTEPAKDGNTFEYKLLNYLIQGSSADQTKEAMRQWYPLIRGTETRFLLTVHDELVGCAPEGQVKRAVRELTEVMQDAMPLDLPVLADPKIGNSYAETK